MAGAGCVVIVHGLKKETDENLNESNEVLVENVRINGEHQRYSAREKSKKSVQGKVVKNGRVSHINGSKKSNKLSVSVRSRRGRPLNCEDSPVKNRRSPRLEKQESVEEHLSSVPLMFECSCSPKMGRTPVIANGNVPSSPARRSLSCQCNKLSAMNSDDLKDRFLQHSKAISVIPGHSREDCEDFCKPAKAENGKIGLLNSCMRNGFSKLGGDSLNNGLIHTKNGVYFQKSHKDTNGRKFPALNGCITTKHTPPVPAVTQEDSNVKSQELVICKWTKCQQEVEVTCLLDHIRERHVETQKSKEKVTCLWSGCKVYEKQSSSYSWLERHMLTHSGAKPFKCIVDGCGQRFSSRVLLERHVNSHFNEFVQSSPKVVRKEVTPTKSRRKKSKRRRNCIIKTTDYVDSQIMEGIKHQVAQLNRHTQVDTRGAGEHVTFHYTVIAKRIDQSGKSKMLIRWTPPNVLEDMWVSEERLPSLHQRIMSIKNLPRSTLSQWEPAVYRRHRFRKQKRK